MLSIGYPLAGIMILSIVVIIYLNLIPIPEPTRDMMQSEMEIEDIG